MIYICVICMVKRPPLSPLAAEHRTLLEAIVSPVINTVELKECLWLLCEDCKVLMQSVYNFQQTALTGVKNLKYLFHKLIKVPAITTGGAGARPLVITKIMPEPEVLIPKEEVFTAAASRNTAAAKSLLVTRILPEPEVLIPKEDVFTATASRNADPLAEELELKSEPEFSASDHEPEDDSEATESCESGPSASDIEQPTVYISTPNTMHVRVIPKMNEGAKPLVVTKIIPEPKGLIPKEDVFTGAASQNLDTNAGPSPSTQRIMSSGDHTHQQENATPHTYKLSEPVKSDGTFEVFTHKPQPSGKHVKYLSSIRWQNGVREGSNIRAPQKFVPVRVLCPLCGKTMDRTSLKSHVDRMHGEAAPRACDVCGKVCRNESSYKHHKAVHKETEVDPAAFCVQCNMQYRDMKRYNIHLQTSQKHATEADYRYKCEECQRKFLTTHALGRHSAIHTDAAYPCDQCDQTFKTQQGRRVHVMRKHQGIEPPRDKLCDHCGKGFQSKSRLASHINSHTGARPFVCKLCGADFGHKSALYLHGRYKHKIQKKKKNDGEKVNSEKGDNEGDNKEQVNKRRKRKPRKKPTVRKSVDT